MLLHNAAFFFFFEVQTLQSVVPLGTHLRLEIMAQAGTTDGCQYELDSWQLILIVHVYKIDDPHNFMIYLL